MRRTLIDILDHMIEDCEDIADIVSRVGGIVGMQTDRPLRKGLVMSILNLGELTKLLEKETDLTDTGIDWKGLKAMREIAAHRYNSMDDAIIWDVAVNHIPSVLRVLLLLKSNSHRT